MKSYINSLYDKFKDCTFDLVYHDNGATPQSMQCYLLVSNLDKAMLKDKGNTVLDLGNYIYRRFGFVYEMPPEYYRSGESKNSVSFYQSKEKFNHEDNKHIREWITKHDDKLTRPESILYERHKLNITNKQPTEE